MSDLMRKLELLWGLPLFYTSDEEIDVKSFGTFLDQESPFLHSGELARYLIEKSRKQDIPVIYKDDTKVYFAAVKSGGGYYLTGPVCTEELSYEEIHSYYKAYHISHEYEKPPVTISLLKILNFVSFLYELLENVSLGVDTLMVGNNLAEDKKELNEKEDAMMELRKIDDEIYHHTYREERYVMDCVREGDTKHVLERMDALVEGAGMLSVKRLNHQRNLAIVSVTAVTREAIAGGVSPAESYRLSDLYINRIDRCTRMDQMVEYMRRSVLDFTKLVAETKEKKASSNYTEQCRDYIHQNYHHKIYLEDAARAIGISPGHLTRVFRSDTGMSVQDYIQKVRVERAANLLKYSEASLSEISDYVCFYSQGHFGSVFKKYMKMTPRQYREKYKQKEFRSEDTGNGANM